MSINAMIAWGVDLGAGDSEKAQLFEDLSYLGEGDPDPTWVLYFYGSDGDHTALVLARSAFKVGYGDVDKSFGEWMSYTFENGEFSIDSQPDPSELGALAALMKATPGAMERDDLFLTGLLLPSYE